MDLEPVTRLTKDLRAAARILSVDEARFLVDQYYIIQEDRKRSANQNRTLTANGEPNSLLEWLATQSSVLEKQVTISLDVFSHNSPVGQWARSQVGIGPIIAAGLLAHIDITKAPTVGHIWRFAGLDPTVVWGKGQKRPFNASLKVLCWKIGESFMKVSGNADAYYGQVYTKRKIYEQTRNDRGDNAATAASILATKNIGKTTEAYKALSVDKLPPGQILARSKRYAVKLFLAHYHDVAYREHYKTDPPLPYAIAHLGHAHYLAPPNGASSAE